MSFFHALWVFYTEKVTNCILWFTREFFHHRAAYGGLKHDPTVS